MTVVALISLGTLLFIPYLLEERVLYSVLLFIYVTVLLFILSYVCYIGRIGL